MDPRISDLLTDHFTKVQANCSAPSLSFAYAVDNETVASSNPSTPFRIASMTKSFTAAAVLILRDRGQLQLDDSVATYVPELGSMARFSADSPEITIRQLLTMSSGLATDDPWADRHLDADRAFLDSLLASGGHFAQAPQSGYRYSNYGYVLLGEVVSRSTNKTFQSFVRDELLDPLDMTKTTWDRPDAAAMPFRLVHGVVVDEVQRPSSDGLFAAMGGLWSTADDLVTWMRFLAAGFPASNDVDDSPLRRSSRREMQAIHSVDPFRSEQFLGVSRTVDTGYGMGLRCFFDRNLGHFVNHSGGLPGYGSNMIWNPDRKVFLVALGNITYAPMWNANNDALQTLHDEGLLAKAEPVVPQVIVDRSKALIALLNEWNNAEATKLFSDNVALDEAFDRRLRNFASITGGQATITEITARNAAETKIQVRTASGTSASVAFTLSSQNPPRVQSFAIEQS